MLVNFAVKGLPPMETLKLMKLPFTLDNFPTNVTFVKRVSVENKL